MLPLVPHRVLGLAPADVAAAWDEAESAHAAKVEKLQHEIAAAREATRRLLTQLEELQAQLKESEAQLQGQILSTLQAQGQGQQILQTEAVRFTERQQRLLDHIREREEQLTAAHQTRTQLAGDLRRLAEEYRRALTATAPVRLPLPEESGASRDPGSKTTEGRA